MNKQTSAMSDQHHISTPSRHTMSMPVLWVAILSMAVIAVMLYSSSTGRSMAERYAPLADAAMEIKLQAAIAHLWFEEIISGDNSIDIKVVWDHLDQVQWYAMVMLEGGENHEGKFVALKDPVLRSKIEQAIEGIGIFRAIAQERWKAKSQSGIGSDIDQRFDKTFNDFLMSADDVETALQKAMARELQRFRILQNLLIASVLVMSVAIAIVLQRHDRRRASDMLALHDKEENLRTTLDSIGDAVIATDDAGSIVRMNPVAEHLTGWNLQYAKHKPLSEIFNIVNAHTKQPAVNPAREVLHRGKIVGLANHTMLIARNGAEYQISDSAAPIRDSSDNITGVVLVFRDVTEEYRMRNAVEKSEAKFRGLVESSNDWIWETNANGEYIYASPQVQATLGYKPHEVIGKTPFDLMPSDEAYRVKAIFKNLVKKGQPIIALENVVLHKDGRRIVLETSGVPVYNDSAQPIGYRGMDRDVTERKKAEVHREQLVAELETKNQEMERLIYTISHDMKTPLVTIGGYLGMLKKDTLTGEIEQVTKDINHIENASGRMRELLDDLLQISRIGRLVHVYENIALTELANQTIELVAGHLPPDNIQFDVSDDLPIIYGDRSRLLELLQNLIENAIKYIGDQSQPRIEIGCRMDDNLTVYYVKDNGIGIAPQYHQKIFDLFEQLDPHQSEGTGAGLAIVKRIVETCNGQIWVESDGNDQGTTFFFTLPTTNSNT